MRILFLLLSFSLFSSVEYVGKNSTEAYVDFNAYQIFPRGLSQSKILDRLYQNTKYLVGPMKLGKYPAGIRGGYKIKLRYFQKINSQIKVHYILSGKMVLKTGAPGIYDFYVLNNPNEAQEKGKNCSYKPNEPWWYNWVPWNNCNLKRDEDYQVVSMKVTRIPNTTNSFPEYNRLLDQDKNLRVDIFFGMARYNSFPWDPFQTTDVSGSQYQKVRKHLLKLGFEANKWSEEDIHQLYRPNDGHYPYIEEFILNGDFAKLKIRMFYGDTGFDYTSKAFHYFYKDSLENSSVLFYGGHSGLGSNINISKVEAKRKFKIKAPKDRYQVFLIESCLPYSYYTQMFHDWKKSKKDPLGTKNLDVIATGGDVTYFSVIGTDFKFLISYFTKFSKNGEWTSYQQMTNDIFFSRALFGVSGDEDNPSAPIF